MEASFWIDLLRNIFGWLDQLVYGFITTVYNVFTNLASYTLINTEVLQTFTQRIYALIGIFMLFKLTFSLITYFIDPDKFSDKKSGFGNLIQRIVISLVLLALTPTIFNLAFKAQTIILEENILANLVLGGSYEGLEIDDREDYYKDAGDVMAWSVLSAFAHPSDPEVLNMNDEELKAAYEDYDAEAYSFYQTYRDAAKEHDIDALVGWGGLVIARDIDDYYLFDYTPFLSTIAGIIVIWVLFIFTIDVAVRAVKLAFLQLIAPVPILGYIDVKKGESMFKNWISESIKTYLDVFVRLLAIYFVIFLIVLISEYGIFQYVISDGELITEEATNAGFFEKALIIIGLLIFAGQVPKLLEALLGIKMGDFTLNPMKKITSSPLAGGVIGGGIGALAGMGMSAYGNYKTNRDMNQGVFKSLASGAGGLFTGAGRGLRSGMSQKTLSGMIGSGSKASGISAQRILEKPNTTFWGRNIARMQQAAGIQTRGGLMEKQVKTYNDFTKNMSNLKTAAGKRLDKKPDFTTTLKDKNGNIRGTVNISQQRALVEALSNRDTSKYDDARLQKHVADLASAKSTLAEAENQAKKDIMKDMVQQFENNQLSSIDDADAIAALDAMKSAINDDPTWFSNLEHQYTDKAGNSYSSYSVNMEDADTFVDQASAAVGQAATKLSTSDEYKQATSNADYAKNASKNGKK